MRRNRATIVGAVAIVLLGGAGPVAPGDDVTFRPTVVVVRGTGQGSGTVIASVPGETLVLTAAHVLESEGDPVVQVHRYNLGLEARRPPEGWPKSIPARVVAIDRAADLAILKVEGFSAMPHVARLAPEAREPDPGTVVTSVGIDKGGLSSWKTRVIESARVDMDKGGGVRPFLLTEKSPDFGRSGGGLFRPDGAVVGVCVGRAEAVRGRRVGIFASTASIHRLLAENGLDKAVARSMARRLPPSGRVETTKGVDPPAPAPMR